MSPFCSSPSPAASSPFSMATATTTSPLPTPHGDGKRPSLTLETLPPTSKLSHSSGKPCRRNSITHPSSSPTNTTLAPLHPDSTQRNSSSSRPGKRAWLTLLTRASYLPGVVILGHSLRKVKSRYPLVVVITPSLPEDCIKVLIEEGFQVNPISPITPRAGDQESEEGAVTGEEEKKKFKMAAERFADTWTKLAVFGLDEYERAILLDSDMLVLRNMDSLFSLPLPPNHIAANHACVCNLDRDPWAPSDWREWNCAYTPPHTAPHPLALAHPCAVTPSSPHVHTLLNSGLIVFTPDVSTFHRMLDFLHTDPRVKDFLFPDQDFLAEFFRGRWKPLGWQWNAIKTMRNWHKSLWRDEEVRNCHYICKKPWNVKKEDEGEDRETHGWWWKAFEEWEEGQVRGDGRKPSGVARRVVRENMGALKEGEVVA